MSATLTVTAKGRVTLSDDLLKHLGVARGDTVAIIKLPGGRINIIAGRSGSIEDAFGRLKSKDNPVLTIEQIKAAAARGWAGSARQKGKR